MQEVFGGIRNCVNGKIKEAKNEDAVIQFEQLCGLVSVLDVGIGVENFPRLCSQVSFIPATNTHAQSSLARGQHKVEPPSALEERQE